MVAPKSLSAGFNAITSFISTDGGRNFSRLRPAPGHLVAAQPYRMPKGGPTVGPGGRGPMGYEAPSNIMQSPKDGYYCKTTMLHPSPIRLRFAVLLTRRLPPSADALMQTWEFGAQQSASAWVNGAGKVIPPLPSLFTLLRPYLAHFCPVFPRFFPFFARFHRLAETVPTSPKPEPRAKKQPAPGPRDSRIRTASPRARS